MQENVEEKRSEQDAADMSIHVPIFTCGSKDVATVLARRDWTVRQVKEDLVKRFMVGADQQILVCCGKVLDDNTAIFGLSFQFQHEEKVWVVFRNVWRASVIRPEDGPLLSSVFAFSGPAPAVCMVQCCKTFEEFCKSHRTMHQKKIGSSRESQYSAAELTWKPNEEEQTRLEVSVQALKNAFGCTNFPQVKWFPEYGCALLVSSIDVIRLSLQIVGPDEWGFMFRQDVLQREYSSTPQSSAGKTLHVAEIDRPSYDKFVSRVVYFLAEAQKRKGESRSAAHNEQGHQKTPAMIMAVVTDSVKSMRLTDEELQEMALTNPRGGFTDVGVHTGGRARDTAWFILEAVVEILLGNHRLFKVSMAQIRIWLTERHFASVLSDASAPRVNQIMKMLTGAVNKAAPLADEEHDMAAFEARCAGIRYQLEEAVVARAKALSASHKLHPTRPLNLCLSDFETYNPVLTVPSAGAVETNAESLETRKEIAETNLGWLPASLKLSSTWHEASEWCSSVERRFRANDLEDSSLLARQLLCRNVERFFYTCIVERPLETSIAEIDLMESVLKMYRSSVYHLKQNYHRLEATSKVGVQSRELLVVWAAFCMVHCSAKNEYHLLDHYGVAVHWSDMQHLVLFDKLAVDAALKVARYLRSSAANGDPIFSHLQEDATFRLAEEYARGNGQMQATWDSECMAASNRKRMRWLQVQAQQWRVRELKKELSDLTDKLRSQEKELSYYEPIVYNTSQSRKYEHRKINERIESLREEISTTRQAIEQEERPPPPLLQPLPESKHRAMEIIFFLEIPRLFQVLLEISFMAQQMLLPREVEVTITSAPKKDTKMDIAGLIEVQAFKLDWNIYYKSHKGLRSPVSLQATLASCIDPPGNVGPSNVMSYTCDKDGVWHPDVLRPGLWWKGGSCDADIFPRFMPGKEGYFNPWKVIPLQATMEYFSEALPNNCQNLQWAMTMDGRDRGNLALANQDAKPGWLSKPQFLSFGSIRAFAHVQDRKVCLALHDQSLPLEHIAVRKLIAQALSQLGKLSDDASPNQIWKTDRREGDLWAALRHALKKLADEIYNKPRDHEKFLTLAEIGAYAGQWDADSLNVSRQLGAIARTWADESQKELLSMDAATPEEQQALASQRAKCCLFSMYAIMSYSGSAELSIEDAHQLCNLSVLAESNRMFEEKTSYETAVRELTVITQEVLTAKLEELLACINQDPKMLTASVRLVLQQTPNSLQWKPICYAKVETSCFEAVCPDGDLYSVNVLKGTVLFNGLPPTRLPSSILDHPLYRRCFADRNFEVVRKRAKLETIRPIRGCLYTFALAGSQRLIIEEVHPDTDVVFELLDGTSKEVEKWGSQLPIRLQSMHSHWICRSPPSGLNCEYWQEITLGGTLRIGCDVMLHNLKERKYNKMTGMLKCFDVKKKRWEVTIASGDILCIKPENLEARALILARHFKPDVVPFVVLRPVIFNQREIHFLLCNVIHRDGNDEWHCFRIPIQLQVENIELSRLQRQLLFFDKLELVSQKAYPLKVLEKFESRRFTHAFRGVESGHTSIILEFPRFDLSFRLSKDKLVSDNFLGYFLAPNQQLENELLSFKRYLVLQNDQGNVKIVIPSGRVVRSVGLDGLTVTIFTGDKEDSALHIYAYDVHPRLKKLTASCIEARLQLAVLYAATGSLLPEQGSQKTGVEKAVELLRESWVNRPLEIREKDYLDAIREFDEHAPSLSLLCQDIMQSSQELCFLHTSASEKGRICDELLDQHISDAASDYIVRKQAGSLNERVKLASYEELNVLGREIPVKLAGRDLPRFGDQEQKLPSFRHLIERCEELLAALKCEQSCNTEVFPFAENIFNQTEMGRQMVQDLADSWEAYRNLKEVRLVKTLDEAAQDLTDSLAICLENIQKGREELEACLLHVMSQIPTFTSWHVPAFRLKMIANLVPIPSISDLAKLAFAPDWLQTFNPFLSERATDTVRDGALQWLQLCMWEDKLVRMLDHVEKQAKSALERELEDIERAWITPYPEWLVFEMEQRLQIRGVQFKVARHLMSNPGAISQLNMGEGKTRVILPMLILKGLPAHSIFRLHILSPLLGEAYSYFHRTLTASLMCRRVHVLPFNRDVTLDATRVKIIEQSLMRCQQLRGVLCIAPEHRLSIELKWHELRVSPLMREVAAELTSLYDLPYLDIMDESDEILRHKHQLIYAVGNCQLLPSGKQRWNTVHVLLERLQFDNNVVGILDKPDVARKACFSDKRAGSFDQIRLIPGRALEEHRSLLMKNLAQSVLKKPSYSMRWLSNVPTDKILQFIMDPESRLTVEDVLQVSEEGLDVRHEQLLALRGFLAYGILERCLTRRHRVDFGIRRVEKPLAQMRRVAVPFRASDTPAERAEFAQPDIMIVFTYIAYYEDGLSKKQFKQTVDVLLESGPSAQDLEYRSWFDSSKALMQMEEQMQIDSVNKIDLSNPSMFDLMYRFYRYNMKTIHFWLSNVVLPVETMVFPRRLVANSWNLADNASKNVVGFSGTNDTKLLLPLQLSQSTANTAQLEATNGKMLAMFLRNSVVHCLTTSISISDEVLSFAVKTHHCSSLIDAGALMAGISHQEVAEKIIKLLNEIDSCLKGVVYFDDFKLEWIFRNKVGRIWSLVSSPVQEKDAFVYFDESRCRGADMKLNSTAVAGLTIGPGMCKDKLMQAAFRMRQLDRGQKLQLLLPLEVATKVSHLVTKDVGLTPKDVVVWIFSNTVESTAGGLPEWASQGSHFGITKRNPNLRLMDEKLGLSDLYGAALCEESVERAISTKQKQYLQKCSADESVLKEIMDQISSRAEKFGKDIVVKGTGLDDECERELENEREIEKEVEREIPRQIAYMENDWNYTEIFKVQHPEALPRNVGVTTFQKQVLGLSSRFKSILWDRNIYMTANFRETVSIAGDNSNDLAHFLRPVDAMLHFEASGTLLLLSERESDSILPLFWKHEGDSNVLFIHLSFLKSGLDQHDMILRTPFRRQTRTNISDKMIASLQLFNGGTMFAPGPKRALEEMLNERQAKEVAISFTEFRATRHLLARSDLEMISDADLQSSQCEAREEEEGKKAKKAETPVLVDEINR